MNISQSLVNIPWHKEFNGFGDTAVVNTATKMKDIINSSAKNPYIRRWAEKIIRDKNVKAYDWLGEIKAIHNWVRDNTRYTHDPKGIEYLQTPPVVLQLVDRNEVPFLDCDDMSMLSLSLLKSVGYDVALKITSYNNSKAFQHVYGLVKLKPPMFGWLPVECIKPDKEFGFEAPNPTRTMIREV